MDKSARKLGRVGSRRLIELALLIALISCGAFLFRQSVAEREAELKAQEQARVIIETGKEAAIFALQTFPAAFGEALKYQYHPEQHLRVTIKVLDGVLLKEPNDVNSRLRRSAAYWELGDREAAKSDLDAILEFQPDNRLALHRRAYLLKKNGDIEATLRDLDRLILLDPQEQYGARNNRAYALAEQGRFEEALVGIEESLELRPESTNSWDTLAYIYVGLGRDQEAIVLYDKVLEAQPNSRPALRGRAVAQNRLGNVDAAKADAARLAEIDPSYCLHWEVAPDPGEHDDDANQTLYYTR